MHFQIMPLAICWSHWTPDSEKSGLTMWFPMSACIMPWISWKQLYTYVLHATMHMKLKPMNTLLVYVALTPYLQWLFWENAKTAQNLIH